MQKALARPLWDRRLGGPIGRHAWRRGPWFAAGPWIFALATLNWLILMAHQAACPVRQAQSGTLSFQKMCYSDVSKLFLDRELASGRSVYGLEYPVGITMVVDFTRRIAWILGAPIALGNHRTRIGAQQRYEAGSMFFAVTAVILFIALLVTLWAQIRSTPDRPWDAVMMAVSPAVLTTGLINWDLLVVMLTVLGMWAWREKRPGLAGVLWGLGVATKLYPILLFVPLGALALRSGRFREVIKAGVAAVAAWAVPNGIIYAMAPKEWLVFWTFNVDRAGDYGSFWYVLKLMGFKVGSVSVWQAVLMVIGALLLVAVTLTAPRRPRFGQLAFLMIAWFLMVNKVYSPQYVLWLLPLVLWARPRWKDFLLWSTAEVLYFCAVWGHLSGTLFAGGVSQDRLYWAAVFLRLGAQLWLVVQVVMDIYQPEDDILRADGADDPHGGVFDGASDAAWLSTRKVPA